MRQRRLRTDPLGEPCNGALDAPRRCALTATARAVRRRYTAHNRSVVRGICLPTPLGDSCNADGECASSLCVEGVCTRRCDEIDCDAPWSCDAATELCVPPPDPEETPGDDGCPVEPCDEPGGVGGGPAFPGGDLPCIGMDCDEASTDDPASSPSGTEGCVGETAKNPQRRAEPTSMMAPWSSAAQVRAAVLRWGLDGAFSG